MYKKYCIRKRHIHLYELRYSVLGKQKSVYGKTMADCKQIYKNMFKKSKRVHTKAQTMSSWFAKWVDLYKKPTISTTTLQKIISIFNTYILTSLGNKFLTAIKTEDIQIMLNKMSQYPRQQTIAFNLVNSCLQQAFLTNLIDYNPCSAVVIKKDKGKKGMALTTEQLSKLHNYLDNNECDIKNLILLYLNTGMRRNELLNINYSDLDFANNEITINGTKTINSTRKLQTTKYVMDLFPKKTKPFNDFTPAMVNHRFSDICKKLGFKNITIHSLRHTFATQCIQNGVDMVVLQKWLGHSSITMTIDRYSHIEDSYKQTQTQKLRELI